MLHTFHKEILRLALLLPVSRNKTLEFKSRLNLGRKSVIRATAKQARRLVVISYTTLALSTAS